MDFGRRRFLVVLLLITGCGGEAQRNHPPSRSSSDKGEAVTQIKFTRSGGFAGAATNVTGRVDFADQGAQVRGENTSYERKLSEQETGKLRSAANPAALTQARTLAGGVPPTPDAYQYDVNVVTGD